MGASFVGTQVLVWVLVGLAGGHQSDLCQGGMDSAGGDGSVCEWCWPRGGRTSIVGQRKLHRRGEGEEKKKSILIYFFNEEGYSVT